MRDALVRASLFVTAALFLLPGSALAQADSQFWGDFTLTWATSPRLTYDFDIEPKVLVSAPAGQPGWASLDLTPGVDYAAKKWLDVVGEFLYASTKQTNDVNSLELTTRAGARFHLLSRSLPTIVRERPLHELPPRRKLVLRDFVRIEQRKSSTRTTNPPARRGVSGTGWNSSCPSTGRA
jgi:hypothetical protein